MSWEHQNRDIPVSYTHLDVYKRQIDSRKIIFMAIHHRSVHLQFVLSQIEHIKRRILAKYRHYNDGTPFLQIFLYPEEALPST